MSLIRLAFVALVLGVPAVAGADQPVASRPRQVAPAEAAARATVARWLAAQNAGRFDDYAALYAPAFEGVKRVGKTPKKMNRAAWLKDRKAMFKAAMQVGAIDVTVTLPAPGTTGGATVDFTQTWASGAFADTGPKRLVLDAAGALIVREELLSSRPVLTEAACLPALYPGASLKRKVTGADDGARPVRLVDVRDLGGRWTCRVLVEREGGNDVAIGLFAFGKRWAVKDRLDLDYDVGRDGDSPSFVDGDVTVEPLPLHPGVPVVQVIKEIQRGGSEYSTSALTTTLYRVDGSDFRELLSWESGGAAGEADKTVSCDLKPEARKSKGWPDLALACTTTEANWQEPDTEPTEATETTRYRWDGDTYVER